MKVSELLKKIGSISGGEIHIEFKADRLDRDPDIATLNEDTPEERADQVVERAAGYTLQEINFVSNVVTITAIKTPRRARKPKADKVTNERREEQKQAIRDELDELKQAVADMIAAIAEPFRRASSQKDGSRSGIIFRATAAVRRILTRIFRIRGDE